MNRKQIDFFITEYINSITVDSLETKDYHQMVLDVTNKICKKEKCDQWEQVFNFVNYIFSQNFQTVKVRSGHSEQSKPHLDLINHSFDYEGETFVENIYKKRLQIVNNLKAIPQFEQGTAEWLAQRVGCLTATAIATVLDEDPYEYPIKIIFDKCGISPPFKENPNVHHGKKYEEIGNMYYSFRNNVKVGEYGMLQHPVKKFIAASPDGICDKTSLDGSSLTKLVGRLLEIKFPKLRKIETTGEIDGDICPHYYYLQVQTQLYVTGLTECDFLQCKTSEYDSWEDFISDSNKYNPGLSAKTGLEKGVLIQLFKKSLIGGNFLDCLYNSKYIYPPKMHMTIEETERWISYEVTHFTQNPLSRDYMIDRVIYWRFDQVSCTLIKAESGKFEEYIPTLKQYWDYVCYYRENPAKLTKLVEYVNNVGKSQSALIFARVHRDYLADNPKTKYTPLYQVENQWRKKYKAKKSANVEKPLELLIDSMGDLDGEFNDINFLEDDIVSKKNQKLKKSK